MKRKIIRIEEEMCNGCGLCIPECPEGAIQVISGKARLVRDLFCDGLGACLGHCPEGAITIEEREAEAYDERIAMTNIVRLGQAHIEAHLNHLREHGEHAYLEQALAFLKEAELRSDFGREMRRDDAPTPVQTVCPGSQSLVFGPPKPAGALESGPIPSSLAHWPIQLHLIQPRAPFFQNADLLLAADCVAYSMGDFHRNYLAGRSLVIACPKLDHGQEEYLSKLKALIDEAGIKTLTVMIMQVPCCGGLLSLARNAVKSAAKKTPIRYVVVGIKGEILREGFDEEVLQVI